MPSTFGYHSVAAALQTFSTKRTEFEPRHYPNRRGARALLPGIERGHGHRLRHGVRLRRPLPPGAVLAASGHAARRRTAAAGADRYACRAGRGAVLAVARGGRARDGG